MKFKFHKGWWLYNAILMVLFAIFSLISGNYFAAGMNLLFAYGFLQGSKLIFWLTFISYAVLFLGRLTTLKNLTGAETAFGLGFYVLLLAFILMLWQQIKAEKKK